MRCLSFGSQMTLVEAARRGQGEGWAGRQHVERGVLNGPNKTLLSFLKTVPLLLHASRPATCLRPARATTTRETLKEQ